MATAPDWPRRLAPPLVFVGIVTGYLAGKGYPLYLPESLILIAGALAAGVLLGWVLARLPGLVAAVVLGLLLILFASMVFSAGDRILDLLRGLGASSAVLRAGAVILFLLPVAAAVLLRPAFALMLSAAMGIFIVATVVQGSAPQVAITRSGPPDTRPPGRLVLHIVLDEFSGDAGLGAPFAAGAGLRRDMDEFFLAHGFRVYRDVFSSYRMTSFSIPALMDFTRPAPEAIRHGTPHAFAWFRKLRGAGYRVAFVGSNFLPLCGGPNRPFVSGCTLFPMYTLDAIRHENVGAWHKAADIARLALLQSEIFQHACGAVRNACPNEAPLSWTALDQFARIRTALEQEGGDLALVAHVLLPHLPVYYDADCRRDADLPGRVQARERLEAAYGGQARCALRQLDAVLGIVDRRWPHATVIIHGDHGLRVPGIAAEASPQSYYALFAVRSAGAGPGLVSGQVNLQSLFAREAGGISLPQSRTVYSDSGAPFELPVRSAGVLVK